VTFKYDAPFERATHPLYNDTKINIISMLTQIINKNLLACVQLVCDKNASKV